MWEEISKKFKIKLSKKAKAGWIYLSSELAERYFIYPSDIVSITSSFSEYTGRVAYLNDIDSDEIEVNELLSDFGFKDGSVCTLKHYQGEIVTLKNARVILISKDKNNHVSTDILKLLGNDIFVWRDLLIRIKDDYYFIQNTRSDAVISLSNEFTQVEYVPMKMNALLGIVVNASNSMNNVDIYFDEETMNQLGVEFSEFPIPVSISRNVPRLSFGYVVILLLLKKLLKTLISRFNLFVFKGDKGFLFNVVQGDSSSSVTYDLSNLNYLWAPLLDFLVNLNVGRGPNQVGNSLLKYYELLGKLEKELPDIIFLITDGTPIVGVHPMDVLRERLRNIDRPPIIVVLLIQPENSDMVEMYQELANETSGTVFVYKNNNSLNTLLNDILDYLLYSFPKSKIRTME